ncbi:MAG: hypothetical protein M1836_000653 [Candelina mexicana]|nr:MAG: hypothetical protein M1836_000653 [Candelina mexicana]
MASALSPIIFLSSTALRLCAYVFLRWIPGHHFPPVVYTALAIYVPAFVARVLEEPLQKVLAKKLDAAVKGSTDSHNPQKSPSVAARSHTLPNGSSFPSTVFNESVEEEPAPLVEDRSHALRTVMTGLPNPASITWSLVTAAINLVLAAMVTDLIYRGPIWHSSYDLSFARVGFVSDHSAKILVREPDITHLPIYVSYRQVGRSHSPGTGSGAIDHAWKSAGQIFWLSNGTDYTSAVIISRLESDSEYEYAVSNNHTGLFTTAPSAGLSSYDSSGTYTFLTSSCIKPRFPYNPFSHPLSIPGLRNLSKWIPDLHAQFMLFLGDFIYIDVPKRFGTDIESYRREYRQVYASPDWLSVSQNLPWIHVLDDHEIANDWDGNTTGVYQAAVDPWEHYHTSVNPPEVRPGMSYFSFTQGPASFFLMDTRRYRSPEYEAPPESYEKTMLGRPQLADLLSWLRRPEPAGVSWKIIASSIPFTKNWRFGNQDTWAGYLFERELVLRAMWDVGLRGGVGVVILSGDRHEFAATAFPPPSDGKWPLSATVHEFSTSPLSQFYLPIRTYQQRDTDDVCIKYIPDGNSKFGAVEITRPAASDQSVLKFRLFVEGEESWSYVLTTPPNVSGSGRGKDALWG